LHSSAIEVDAVDDAVAMVPFFRQSHADACTSNKLSELHLGQLRGLPRRLLLLSWLLLLLLLLLLPSSTATRLV
jgi:hypothetical protein